MATRRLVFEAGLGGGQEQAACILIFGGIILVLLGAQ